MRKHFRPFIVALLLVGLLLGWVGHGIAKAPTAYAQGIPNDQFVGFTVATGTGPVAATLVAASSGKKIYIKAIIVSSGSSGSANFYDGTATTTTLTTAAILANNPTILDPSWFVGGGGTGAVYPSTTSGNALGLQVTAGTVTGTVRYQQY